MPLRMVRMQHWRSPIYCDRECNAIEAGEPMWYHGRNDRIRARQPEMPSRTGRNRVVYTTDPDPEPEPLATTPAYPSARQQTARIARDRKRRAGKTVTVISGLRHDPATLQALLTTLKQ